MRLSSRLSPSVWPLVRPVSANARTADSGAPLELSVRARIVCQIEEPMAPAGGVHVIRLAGPVGRFSLHPHNNWVAAAIFTRAGDGSFLAVRAWSTSWPTAPTRNTYGPKRNRIGMERITPILPMERPVGAPVPASPPCRGSTDGPYRVQQPGPRALSVPVCMSTSATNPPSVVLYQVLSKPPLMLKLK